jgi:hypothetical protein
MALTDGDSGNMVMPVSPMYGGGNNGFGFGGDWAWILLLLLLGWGNNGWGGGGFDGGAGGLYPWMNQTETINDGFRDQMMNTNITSIRDGISDISTQLCTGFAGVNAGIASGFAQSEISANARQMADMNQRFALQSQLADCCCENRLASCQTQNIVQSEGSATRFADANNTRDIIDSQTRGTQAILDKLCQLELDGVKGQLAQAERENIGLQNALNMASFRESQTAQNALITQGFSNEVDALYNRLNSCPVPTTPVYGRTPIFTCNGSNGTGCGCGSF